MNVPASGSPAALERDFLLLLTVDPLYNQTEFLNGLGTTTPPTDPPASNGTFFSPTSFWNTQLSSSTPIAGNSSGLINELVANTQLAQPWINTTNYSTTYYEVDANTPKVKVNIVQNGLPMIFTKLYSEGQKGFPIPANAIPSSGSDGHITIYDKSTDTLYEFWQFKKVNGQWQASWGGVLTHASTSNGLMPNVINAAGGNESWGARATGLPFIGGTIMIKELQAGVIPHALAMSIVRPKQGTFVPPAKGSDGWWSGANAIPEGTRFKFPANVYINPSWPPIIKMMVVAARDYGIVVADQSGSVSFYAEDPTPTGSDPYPQYYGGKNMWDFMDLFPFGQLQVIA